MALTPIEAGVWPSQGPASPLIMTDPVHDDSPYTKGSVRRSRTRRADPPDLGELALAPLVSHHRDSIAPHFTPVFTRPQPAHGRSASGVPRTMCRRPTGNERLKARLARKDEVIAEGTEELIRTKKSVGEP